MNEKFIRILKTLLLGLCMFILCELSLILISAIPNEWIQENVEQGIDVVRNMEGYDLPQVFNFTQSSKLDNYTDREMLRLMLEPDGTNLLERAQIPEYFRYWQEYLVFIKPLFMFMNYTQIRYLYMFIHIISLVIITILLEQKVSVRVAINYAIAMCMVYVIILPFSLQYSSVFFVMYIANMLVLLLPEKKMDDIFLLSLFFGVGGNNEFCRFFDGSCNNVGIAFGYCCTETL